MGIALSIGVLIYLSIEFKFLKRELKNLNLIKFYPFLFFILSVCFSSTMSIQPIRSFKVILYLFLFVVLSFCLFLILKNKKDHLNKIFNIFYISSHFNILLIFIYQLSNYSCIHCWQVVNFSDIIENIRLVDVNERFKGFLNIFTLNIILISFLKKNKLNIITLVCLIPSLVLSNCNTAIFGVILALAVLVIFNLLSIKINNKAIFSFFSIMGVFSFFYLASLLPNNFEKNEIENFEPIVSQRLLDVHRQFMWGFSFMQFKEKPFFGFGPDTSNFIKDGQRVIGSKYTGDMFFISSHPHNFIFEVLLELGIVGTLLFLYFIIYVNYLILRKCDQKNMNIYIFFNSYFWGTSLLNFSFWLGWWQASYYIIFSLLAATFSSNKK